MIVYLNGAYLERARAVVSVDDRGFLFGDGVYEVTRAVNGQLFEWERHARRLARGLEGLGIQLAGGLERIGLPAISERLLDQNGLGTGDAPGDPHITRRAPEGRPHV